jgi:hypothetical protein
LRFPAGLKKRANIRPSKPFDAAIL